MKNDLSIDNYIKKLPEELQVLLLQMRLTIQVAAPKATESMSYGMPTFKLNGNLVHFAAFKNHIGFYPTPSAIIAFKKNLTKYKTSKGAIQFQYSEKLPLGLVSKIVKFRVKEQNLKVQKYS